MNHGGPRHLESDSLLDGIDEGRTAARAHDDIVLDAAGRAHPGPVAAGATGARGIAGHERGARGQDAATRVARNALLPDGAEAARRTIDHGRASAPIAGDTVRFDEGRIGRGTARDRGHRVIDRA